MTGSAAELGRPLRIVAFGTYQADEHPRVRVLIEGARAAGHEVVEINEPLGLSTADRVGMLHHPWMAPRLLVRLALRWTRLWRRGRRLRRDWQPDSVLVGYLGHFDVHLARLVFGHCPVALDHLIFAASTALDRGKRPGLVTRSLARLDRLAMGAADVIVVDTQEHRDLVPARWTDRTVVCSVGADARWFEAGGDAIGPPAAGEPLRVAFFGLYIPLHGAPVIGEALRLLAGRTDVVVTMIGAGQELENTRAAAGAGAPVVWHGMVPADKLPRAVARQHVALGIFGTTPKAAAVVPNKIFQSAAAGNALITSDTVPQRRVLGDAAIFVEPGDPVALADAVTSLAADPQRLAELRRRARELALAHFTPDEAAAPLLERLVAAGRSQLPRRS